MTFSSPCMRTISLWQAMCSVESMQNSDGNLESRLHRHAPCRDRGNPRSGPSSSLTFFFCSQSCSLPLHLGCLQATIHSRCSPSSRSFRFLRLRCWRFLLAKSRSSHQRVLRLYAKKMRSPPRLSSTTTFHPIRYELSSRRKGSATLLSTSGQATSTRPMTGTSISGMCKRA